MDVDSVDGNRAILVPHIFVLHPSIHGSHAGIEQFDEGMNTSECMLVFFVWITIELRLGMPIQVNISCAHEQFRTTSYRWEWIDCCISCIISSFTLWRCAHNSTLYSIKCLRAYKKIPRLTFVLSRAGFTSLSPRLLSEASTEMYNQERSETKDQHIFFRWEWQAS